MRRSSSPRREKWEQLLSRAGKDGCYELLVGEELPSGVSVVVDSTGFSPEISWHPLLADLDRWATSAHLAGTDRPATDGLALDAAGAVRGTRHGSGAVYVTGQAAATAPIGPVDAFWGLTSGAFLIAENLASRGVCPRFESRSSVRG